MRKKFFDLQLFTDGGEGGAGTAGAGAGTAGNGNGSQNNAWCATYSYEQAEQIAQARADRAEKAALADFFKDPLSYDLHEIVPDEDMQEMAQECENLRKELCE